MSSMNTESVESYLAEGCGRCDKYRTPECKVHLWTDALVALRGLLLDTELEEAMKWGSPTYAWNGKNVLMLVSRADHCSLSFFKGAGLDDPEGVLESPGPNSRFARYLKFDSVDDVMARYDQARGFVLDAIEFERAGKKIEVPDGRPEPIPDELADRLAADADLREAFDALTPGRQRSYILHIGGAKQAATRERRVDKCAPKIFTGKGFNER